MSGNGLRTDRPDRHRDILKDVRVSGCPSRQSGSVSAAPAQSAADRRRAADRERQRRCRQRLKKKQALYRCAAGGDVLNMLVSLGYLKDAEADDEQKVGEAITALLAESARE